MSKKQKLSKKSSKKKLFGEVKFLNGICSMQALHLRGITGKFNEAVAAHDAMVYKLKIIETVITGQSNVAPECRDCPHNA